jgi:hypothetical protein
MERRWAISFHNARIGGNIKGSKYHEMVPIDLVYSTLLRRDKPGQQISLENNQQQGVKIVERQGHLSH